VRRFQPWKQAGYRIEMVCLRLRAAKDARKTARMYGTPLYVWENGKVVAKKP